MFHVITGFPKNLFVPNLHQIVQNAPLVTNLIRKIEKKDAKDGKAGVGGSGAELGLAKFGGEGEAARNPGFRHMDGEPVLGELSWDFFTTGYQPLRVAAVCRRVQRLAGGWLRVGCM